MIIANIFKFWLNQIVQMETISFFLPAHTTFLLTSIIPESLKKEKSSMLVVFTSVQFSLSNQISTRKPP